MVWANVVNALLGIWFILSPFVLKYTDHRAALWLGIIGGAVLLILAGWAVFSEEARRQKWIQYVNGLVGIWFIIFPYVFALTAVTNVVSTSVIGGIIALVLSAWLAFSALPKEAHA